MKNIRWNTQQAQALTDILNYILSPVSKVDSEWGYLLMGWPGTGKTTLFQEVAKQALQHNPELRICITAPSNKAVEVVRTVGDEAGITVDCATIHSILGLVLGTDREDPQCFQGGEGRFCDYDVICIDEGSLAGKIIAYKVKEQAQIHGIKVIVMGDDGQTNPVNEKETLFFDPNFISNRSVLTKLMRQETKQPEPYNPSKETEHAEPYNPSKALIFRIRGWIDGQPAPNAIHTDLDDEGSGVHILLGKDFISTMKAQFNSDEYKADPNFCRALAYSNNEVDHLNSTIREEIYGKNCEDLIVGERVIVKQPVLGPEKVKLLNTNDECQVLSISKSTYKDTYDYDSLPDGHPIYNVWIVELSVPKSKLHNIASTRVTAICGSSMAMFDKRLDFLHKKAKAKQKTWGFYWATSQMFVKLKPAHAMTVHNAQGQTFKTTFFNASKCLRNNYLYERKRLFNVGCSRHTTDLVINVKTIR